MSNVNLGACTAYAIALAHGFEGTEAEWLAALKGDKGDKGEKGDPGAQGAAGAAGKSAYAAAQEQGFSGTETAFGAALSGLPTHLSDTNLHISASERTAWNAKLDASQKGTANGVATLGIDGKVPTAQLPEMDYDAAGSAEAVRRYLYEHMIDQKNPHGVTAEQVGARPASWTPTAAEVGAAPDSHISDRKSHLTASDRIAWDSKAPGSHVGDSTHITDDERAAWNAKAAKPTVRTLTLSTDGWDSAAKTQTVTCSGVSADETAQLITVTPALASQTAYLAAGIRCTGQAADALTFTASTVPTESLTVYAVIQTV